jgi:uncharacterized protein (DUF2062 family)
MAWGIATPIPRQRRPFGGPLRQRLRELWQHLKSEHTTPARLGVAVGVGVAIGVTPFYGLHWAIGLGVAAVLGLNKLTVVLASNISIPPLAPFIVTASVALGDLMRFGTVRGLPAAETEGLLAGAAWFTGELSDRFLSCLLGSGVLGAALGTSLGLVVWRWARRRGVETS